MNGYKEGKNSIKTQGKVKGDNIIYWESERGSVFIFPPHFKIGSPDKNFKVWPQLDDSISALFSNLLFNFQQYFFNRIRKKYTKKTLRKAKLKTICSGQIGLLIVYWPSKLINTSSNSLVLKL